MQRKRPLQLLVASLMLAVYLGAPAGAPAADGSPAQSVVTLSTSINVGDIDGSVRLFTADAVVIQPRVGGLPQIYVGREQIRVWLRHLVAQHANVELSGPPAIVDNRVRVLQKLSVDAFRELGLRSVEVESDAVLADDSLIQSLTTVFTPRGARNVQEAPGPASADLAELSAMVPSATSALLLGLGFASGAVAMILVNRRRAGPLSLERRAGEIRRMT